MGAMAEAWGRRMAAAAATMAGWPIDGMDPIDGGGRHPGPVNMKIELARSSAHMRACRGCRDRAAHRLRAHQRGARAARHSPRAAAPQRAALASARAHLTGMQSHHSIMSDADELPACSSASCCCARASSCSCRCCCCAATPTLSSGARSFRCCCSAFASSSALARQGEGDP